MTGSVEKNYSLALFQLAEELQDQNRLREIKEQLTAVNQAVKDCPDFVKLMDAPTVSHDEKAAVLKEAFGNADGLVYNFLRVVMENGRFSYLGKITGSFRDMYNEKLGIGEITVTSSTPLNESQLKRIKAKMEEITGKSIVITQKTDKDIMGGLVIDYGDKRYDGSVRARLEALKQSFSQLI